MDSNLPPETLTRIQLEGTSISSDVKKCVELVFKEKAWGEEGSDKVKEALVQKAGGTYVNELPCE